MFLQRVQRAGQVAGKKTVGRLKEIALGLVGRQLDDLRLPGPYGFDKAAWARAQATYAKHFGGDAEKSSYNLFTQNQWYAGKLVSTGRLPGLRRLIDNQQEFISAFEEIIRRPDEQETVLRDMAVRCLT